MATIKYLLQSKTSTAPIYLRLSLGRRKSIKRKTGFIIDYKLWSSATGFPKERDAEGKKIKTKLKNLEAHVIKNFNDNPEGLIIDGIWLDKTINKYANRETPDKLNYLLEYGEKFVERLPDRVTAKGKKGVSKATITKYTTIVAKIKGFQEYKKHRYLIKEVNLKFREEFIKYLTEIDIIGDNSAGRYIGFVKTIVLDARKNGIKVSPQLDDFKGFSVKPPIVTLTLEEINKIKATDYKSEQLDITRDWLIIGCFTGQRVSDLLRMNMSMIEEVSNYKFIVLEQVKTEKTVQIPIHNEVESILKKRNGQFPPLFAKTPDSNSTMFNRYLKEVCRIAKIDAVVEGNHMEPETKRTKKGKFPKWKLISSHTCRRSFATNFYAQTEYPTPLLMSVTGHTTEAMFLEYIGKKPFDHALQLAKIWANKSKKKKGKKAKSKLRVLRTGSNS